MWERARTAANFLESGPGSGICKSTDGGTTWTRLSGGLPPGATVGRIGLAMAASRPDTLYAVLDNQALRPEAEPADEETPPGELTPRRLRARSARRLSRASTTPSIARFLRRNDFPKYAQSRPRSRRTSRPGGSRSRTSWPTCRTPTASLFEKPDRRAPRSTAPTTAGAHVAPHARRSASSRSSTATATTSAASRRTPRTPSASTSAACPCSARRTAARPGRGWTAAASTATTTRSTSTRAGPNRLALGNDGGLNLSFDHGETWIKVNNLPVGQFTTIAVDGADPYNIARAGCRTTA